MLMLFAATAMAQGTTAEIVGTVVDNSGGVMPHANVTVTHVATGVKRSMETNTTGEYDFTQLPIGTYSVVVEAAGFKRYLTPTITLQAGDRTRVDVQMQLGEVNQTLEVTGQAPLLQTDSATVGSTVSSVGLEDLPTNGRNFVTLVQVGAGMNESNQSSLGGGNRPDDRRATSTISANGQNDSANNFMLDGMDNNERAIGTVIVKPSMDALAEIQVQSSLYPASTGRAGGAVINEITKSGTNAFHGSLYEFLRNDKFDAKNVFNVPEAGNPLAGVKPEYRQNQFGASLGGAIRKDKLFFFLDYEGFRKIEGTTYTSLIPTACELGRAACNGVTQVGNFSDMLGTGVIKSASGSAFPNNVIPLSLINQVSQDYAALYPTLPASACQGTTCLFTDSPNATQYAHTADARIDYHVSDKNSFFGRYSINQTDSFIPPLFPAVNVAGLTNVQGTGANFNAQFPGTAYQRQQSLTLGYTHIFGPNLILQLGVQGSRYVTDSESLNNGKNINTAFGGPANLNTSQAGSSGLTMMWFLDGDYNDVGDQFALPTIYYDTNFDYSGTLNWNKGAHSIKIGASLIHREWSVNQQLFKGAYMFTGGIGPGNDFAAMLEGDPFIFLRNMSLTAPQYRANEIGTYIQDDWRLNKWLTLNLGVRWDVFTPMTEKHDALSNFDPTNAAMLTLGLIRQAGKNGVSNTDGFSTQYHDIQPRLGFAATLGHGAVLRGGFGTTYFPDTQASPAYLKNAPITSSATDVFPGWVAAPPTTPDPTCLVASCGATGTGSVPAATALNFKWPVIYMVDVTLEKEIGSNVISGSYVGQYTRSLGRVIPNVDMPLPPLGPGGCGSTATMNLPSPCQPYYNQIPLVSSIQLLESNGTVNYSALEVLFQRHLSKGLTVSSNYTYTSNLSDTGGPGGTCPTCSQVVGDWSRDYGPNMYMVRHRFALSSSYALPFGNNLKGFAGTLGKGWQINGIYVYSTGIPFTVQDGLDTQNTDLSGGNDERMNVVPRSAGFHRSTSEWFDITQFREQPFGTAGNEGMDDFFMPPYRHLDLSLFKDFQIKESVRLQFRAESFNITNTPNFGMPNLTVSSYNSSGVPTTAGDFGAITSTNTFSTPRELQFALKLIF
jgi:hypothetical protein